MLYSLPLEGEVTRARTPLSQEKYKAENKTGENQDKNQPPKEHSASFPGEAQPPPDACPDDPNLESASHPRSQLGTALLATRR